MRKDYGEPFDYIHVKTEIYKEGSYLCRIWEK